MIKLFKNIRNKLLKDGKKRRYFKYAIGEIILVVIGILIALQINNWNESRKDRAQEIMNLKNIQQDILLDTVDIRYNIKLHTLFQSLQKKSLNYIHSKGLQTKEVIKFEYALETPLILTLHKSSFSNLKDNNINIISNTAVKKQISNHYDNISTIMLRIENDLNEYKTDDFLKPYFLKYFSSTNEVSKLETTEFNSSEYYNSETYLNNLVLRDTLGLKNDAAFAIELAESISFTRFKNRGVQLFFNRYI